MTNQAAENKAQLINKILATVGERLSEPAGTMVQQFAYQYYHWVAPEDLLNEDPEDLYGAVLSHWNFIRQRPRGTLALRVYNPNFEEHGWQSTHTVIEIVTDNMPFLVDSVTTELNRHGLTVHRIIHPVIRVVRDGEGVVTAVLAFDSQDGDTESIMHFELDRETDPASLETLARDITRVLGDVRAAVEDWPKMRRLMLEIVTGLDTARLPLPTEEIMEIKEFLRWVADEHFTFLGYRAYELVIESGEVMLRNEAHSGLGILRGDPVAAISESFAELPSRLRELALAPTLLLISKANARSTVHRPAYLDYLGIKRFDAAGKVIGEWRFLGLYAATAYSEPPRNIPLLRSKIAKVLRRAGLHPEGHDYKALCNILDTFPRDELFQIGDEELFDIATGILNLQERQRLRLFLRRDPFERFLSCLIYVPRERYHTELRIRIEDILMRAFNGRSATFTTQFSESVLARLLFYIRTVPGELPDYDPSELEARLREAMLSWKDELYRVLLEHCGEERGNELFQRYADAFPAAYREDFTTRTAVSDILHWERIDADYPLGMRLYRPLEEPEGLLRFKVFGLEQPIPLSEVLPILEKMGLQVLTARPYEIETREGSALWVLDFDMREDQGIEVDVNRVRDIFQDAFARIWTREVENDGFNRLVLGASLAWRDVVVLRAYCKYLLQTRVPFSQAYMEHTLANHPQIAGSLVGLFHARFDPHLHGDAGRRSTALGVQVEEALEKVSNLDEDRILRHYLNLIRATVRTNFFQTDHHNLAKEYVTFKLDPLLIEVLPLPRPMFEIFVYSPRTEAVHLRGGPVARGGLRWSDRREDFRTEVLGLMKAQMVKNSVIVPVGAKGGFVVKRPPLEREALQAEAVYCYSIFIRGMLDLTDNLANKTVIPPPSVIRYDHDDPYLVVAADKGTATFSDIANSISLAYGYWLGDAFASGGSTGYDHKKMGITARGAWESVKRHFREMGKDIQNRDDFTVLGIGDMNGDVFGNGMLQSRHIKLLAAFNHTHIFLDPAPDPEISYRERQRLFNLPRSTWADYDSRIISAGGGVYLRTAKSIPVSPEVRAALNIQAQRLTPNELIHNLLKAPVDLLWNGGIGTFVKASSETHSDAGDRANDAVRVNGKDLHCVVVGEGGNLGFTQRGRIEYALRGGRILTDAIDNSGGVNCSDHEVNIKILLNQVVANGDMTSKQRNQLLAAMSDEVADLVLRQNYLQPQAISMATRRAAELLGDHTRVMRLLEKGGRLNRALEMLPEDVEIVERETAHQGLTGPEIAVLLAYSKITLKALLLDSNVPEDPYLKKELLMYFPSPLREAFAQEMENHPLRREIIATYISNSMLNRMDSGFALRLWEETGESYPAITRAYTAAREMFDLRCLWSTIEALDNRVPAAVQIRMMGETQRLLERASLWLLRHRRSTLDIETLVTQFSAGIAALAGTLVELLQAGEQEAFRNTCQELIDTGVSAELAQQLASLDALYSALDLVEVATQEALPVTEVASVYFGLVSHLEFSWLRQNIAALPTTNHWQNRARAALLNNLYEQASSLTATVLKVTSSERPPAERLATWLERNRTGIERCRGIFADLRASGKPDLAMLSVAVRETAHLAQGTGE